MITDLNSPVVFHGVLQHDSDDILMQFTGLTDKNGIDYYLGDIGEFSNGDKFYLAMEGWLEVYIEWIGQPECEDQGRDLYRIGNAKIIGNIHQHSHLLDKGE